MNAKLEIANPKSLHQNGNIISSYENEFYVVYVKESGPDLGLNIVRKEFTSPTIDFYNGKLDMNVPATGSLSVDKIRKHMELIEFACQTIEEIELLRTNYVFNELEANEECQL